MALQFNTNSAKYVHSEYEKKNDVVGRKKNLFSIKISTSNRLFSMHYLMGEASEQR